MVVPKIMVNFWQLCYMLWSSHQTVSFLGWTGPDVLAKAQRQGLLVGREHRGDWVPHLSSLLSHELGMIALLMVLPKTFNVRVHTRAYSWLAFLASILPGCFHKFEVPTSLLRRFSFFNVQALYRWCLKDVSHALDAPMVYWVQYYKGWGLCQTVHGTNIFHYWTY